MGRRPRRDAHEPGRDEGHAHEPARAPAARRRQRQRLRRPRPRRRRADGDRGDPGDEPAAAATRVATGRPTRRWRRSTARTERAPGRSRSGRLPRPGLRHARRLEHPPVRRRAVPEPRRRSRLDDGASSPAARRSTARASSPTTAIPTAIAITAVDASAPAHGALALDADGTFTYQPQAGFKGTDSFTYRASDGTAQSAPATVTISVGNQPPTAADDAYDATSGATLDGASVLANDSDPNGDALTATLTSGPAHGTLQLAPGGTFTYTPDAGFTGRDAFTYSASDGARSRPRRRPRRSPSPASPVAPPPPPPAPARAAACARAAATRCAGHARAGQAPGPAGRRQRRQARRARARSRPWRPATSAWTTAPPARRRPSTPRSRSGTDPLPHGRCRGRQRSKPTGIFTLTLRRLAARAARQRRACAPPAARRSSCARPRGSTPPAAGASRARSRRARAASCGCGSDTTRAAATRRASSYRAKIHGGAWPARPGSSRPRRRSRGQLSIQFTGYERLRIRGEQLAKEVARGG